MIPVRVRRLFNGILKVVCSFQPTCSCNQDGWIKTLRPVSFLSTRESYRKRKRDLEEEVDTYSRNKRRRRNNDGNENNGHFLALSTAEAEILMISRQQEPRKRKVDRDDATRCWWTNGYANWSETEFKNRVRINRNHFEFILRILGPYISKTPTNAVPNPIENHRQLAVTPHFLGTCCGNIQS